MEESKEDLTKRLAENQKRLDELGADKKSSRKRILGQISKIKAQLDGRRPKEGNGGTKKRKVRVDEPAAEHHGVVGGISKKVKREQLREKKKKESEAKGKEKAAVSDRKKAKLRLQWLNKQISSLGQRKELSKAVSCFDQVSSEGLAPSVHTYTSIINAHVRSGEIDAAEGYLERMRGAGLSPNVVTYTALLKGFTQMGDLGKASGLLEQMEKDVPPVAPNVRTVNTMLRGCIRANDVPCAVRVFSRLGGWGCEPDSCTYESMVKIYCQALDITSAGKIGGKLRVSPSACVSFATAHALLGDEMACSQSLADLDRALEAWDRGEGGVEHDGGEGRESVKLFREHQGNEWRLEGDRVRALIKSGGIGEGRGGQVMGRVLLFSSNLTGGGAAEGAGGVVKEMVRGLTEGYGLGAIEGGKQVVSTIKRSIGQDGVLNFGVIFGGKAGRGGGGGGTGGGGLPVKLELGSGTGEWVVAQAKADKGKANWVSLELRADRVHQTYTRMAFEGAHNLCVLGGDAKGVLSRHIGRGSVSQVLVNFPEPPVWSGGGGESATHMLSDDFLESVHGALALSGTLTIHSDNMGYLDDLAGSIGALKKGGKALYRDDARLLGAQAVKNVGGITVWDGAPGSVCGHSVQAASYFDRLWEHGKRVRRGYVFVRAV